MTKSLKKSSVGDTIGREAILDIRKGGNMGKTLSKAEQELLDSLPDDAKALISEIQKDHDEELQELADLLPDEEDEADDDSEEAILGKADPAVLAIIQKSRDEAAEATKIAKAERDMRIDREMLAKAADYKTFTGTPQEKAELLKAAFAVSEDFGKKLEQTFKAANARLDTRSDCSSSPRSARRQVCRGHLVPQRTGGKIELFRGVLLLPQTRQSAVKVFHVLILQGKNEGVHAWTVLPG